MYVPLLQKSFELYEALERETKQVRIDQTPSLCNPVVDSLLCVANEGTDLWYRNGE